MELQAVTESPTVAYIQALIAFTHQWLNDAYQQDAGPNGSAAAPFDRSTQPKDWVTKRAGQERDYGWAA